MMHSFFYKTSSRSSFCATLLTVGGLGIATLVLTATAATQDANLPQETVKDGYAIHQSIDLGGNIVDYSGSGAMYDTLVNQQSGPRVLTQSLEMNAVGKKARYPLFDSLMTTSTGYGGGPINFTTLSMSKGKIYNFDGIFRRDRQYFDYNLLGNPLVPPGVTSNGYTFPQVKDYPHYFNTVRRMLDTNLTLFPLSKLTFRAGYSNDIMQGPTGSSVHFGTEALLLQNWRNSTDSWTAAVDWKPLAETRLTFEEYVVHYKGNTNWELGGLNLQLADGTPVSLGFDNITAPTGTVAQGTPATKSGIILPLTSPPTANSTANGYLQYSRYAPTRTLFPTEEFLFQSSSIKNVQMNGRIRYTGASMKMPNYREYFNGLESRTHSRAITTTGHSEAERVNVSADYGITWQMSKRINLSDQFDFWYFRQPADSYQSAVEQTGSNMLVAPGAPEAPAITAAHAFLGQKTVTNTATAVWEAASWASVSVGYRYTSRTIDRSMTAATDALPNGTAYTLPIHENAGLFGVDLLPTPKWKINGTVEIASADNAYTQISPRQLQHYNFHTTYKPKDWATISAAFNDRERRNNVTNVKHQEHSRSLSLGASLMPNVHYGLDLNYAYTDVFSKTTLCYDVVPAPPGATTAPTACGTNVYLGNGYYDAPTEYGSIGIILAPTEKIRTSLGYRMSAVNGTQEFLNPRQVPGSLQSQYQSPYAEIALTVVRGWSMKADWNYYSYGEGSPIGPTAPRSFRGNLYTLGMHHQF